MNDYFIFGERVVLSESPTKLPLCLRKYLISVQLNYNVVNEMNIDKTW